MQVAVCGGGVIGACLAYFLARRGAAVTVFERTAVACAASGKSGGFLALDWCDGTALGPLARAKALAIGLLAVRHLLLPLVAVALVWAFSLPPTQAIVLMVFSAQPTASTCHVLAARMGYNGPFVAGLVTLSTALGLASLPFALGLLGLLPAR